MSLNIPYFNRFDTGSELNEDEFDRLEQVINEIIKRATLIPDGYKDTVLGWVNGKLQWVNNGGIPSDGNVGDVLTKTETGIKWESSAVNGYTKNQINLAILGLNGEKDNLSNLNMYLDKINGITSNSIADAINELNNYINLTNDSLNKKINNIYNDIGDLNNLPADSKNIVDAINYMYENMLSGETVLTADIVITTDHVGSRLKNYVFKKGINFTEFVRIISTNVNIPMYIQPNAIISFIGADGFRFEVGTFLNITIKVNEYNKNDAGEFIKYIISEDSTMIFESTEISDYNMDPFYIAEGVIKILCEFFYGDGDLKYDSEGNPAPNPITAGKLSYQYNFVGYRNAFYSSDTGDDFPLNSNKIRNGKVIKDIKNNRTFDINISKGDTRVWFAYPADLGEINNNSVKSKEMNTSIGDIFEKKVIQVNGNNNKFPKTYNVYLYQPLIPYAGNDIYTISI